MPDAGTSTEILVLITNIGGEGGVIVRYISELVLLPNPRLNLHFQFCPSVRRQITCSKCPWSKGAY